MSNADKGAVGLIPALELASLTFQGVRWEKQIVSAGDQTGRLE